MTENIENNVEAVVEVAAPMTAGEMLRNARTTGRRKREIPTISKQLCIREEFLEALENGNYSVIPEPVYILGFARNYAMELGLNPDEVVEKIKKEMGLASDCADDEDATACAMPSIKEESWGKIALGKAYQFVYQNWMWFAGAIAAIALLVTLLIVLQPSGDAASDVAAADAVVTETVTGPAFTTDVQNRYGTSNRDDAVIILQANDKAGASGVYIELRDARGKRIEGVTTLMKGDVYYLPKSAQTAIFGNAGATDVWVDGKLAPRVGGVGERKEKITLTPKALMGK